jgi:hypothetical protein
MPLCVRLPVLVGVYGLLACLRAEGVKASERAGVQCGPNIASVRAGTRGGLLLVHSGLEQGPGSQSANWPVRVTSEQKKGDPNPIALLGRSQSI